MAKVTALGLDVITEKSGHVIAPVTPSVCITPAAPAPLPVPYPTTGSAREGIVGAPSRTRINGAKIGTVGGAFKESHGNEPGTLKEVVSHNTGGASPLLGGAPIVVVELGMVGTTGSPAMENKSPGSTARTAPAPALGAGMTFGVAVLGGGSGNGGADGEGGDADGDGDGTGGDGDGDGDAPDGQDGQCAGGHPVDVITGRAYTLPAIELELPGPLPLVFARVYSTAAAERDTGLGFGWSHAWSWEIEVQRHAIVVWSDEGIATRFPMIEAGAERIGPWGWSLRRERERFVLDKGDGLRRVFAAADEDARRWRLIAIHDRRENRIELTYDEAGALCEVTDSAGRTVGVETTRAGRIASIQVNNARAQGRWMAVARYTYDDQGNLAAVIDAEGHATRYQYDADHRLTRETDRTGLSFCFAYDRAGRCVETWGEYPGRRDASLAEDVPALLADGRTKARGVHHVRLDYGDNRYTEVADSRQVRRYFGNTHGLVDKEVEGGAVVETTYDERGLVVARTDGERAVTRYERDQRGRELRVVDPLGRTTTYERDAHGDVVRVVDPAGGVYELHRDEFGDVIHEADPTGAVTSTTYDARGLVTSITSPTGGVTRLEYDQEGNLVVQTEPTGGRWRWAHDPLGRRVEEVDPLGNETRFAWTQRGDLAAVYRGGDAVTRYLYDGERRLIEIQGPGRRTIGLTWGGYDKLIARTDGAGGTMLLRYDREGDLIEVVNELGEVHRTGRDGSGQVVREETFDGRLISYKYDKAGRLVREEVAREVTKYKYNAAGELVRRTLADEREESFTYTPRGELMAIGWTGGELLFERDAAGRVLREVQSLRGDVHTVASLYDQSGERVRRSTSRGHVEHIERDATGARTRTILDELHDVHHARDPLGRESRRALPRGGSVEQTHDREGRVVRRWAMSAGSLRPVRFDDPGWAGTGRPAQPDRVTVEHEHRYTPEGERSDSLDRRRGWLQYDYDAAGRLTSLLREATGEREVFTYDAAGNPQPRGVPCTYGPGGRLLKRGGKTYVWDAAGRLQETRDGAEIRRFAWDAAGRLAGVALPGGERVEFTYDPLGRRVEARRYEAARLHERTRFVWDGDTLAHEIRTRAASEGDPIVEERTFCFEDGGFIPWAHCEAGPDGYGGRTKLWAYYVNDPIGTPEELVDGAGGVLAELDREAWGRTTSSEGARVGTPLRFQGQYEDEGTGLTYNRFRYYDAEAGLYVSPDPIGLEGGPRVYGYGINPVGWIDPLGLTTGIVYLRVNRVTGKEYVGRADGKANYKQRQRIHNRRGARKCPGTKYDYHILQSGINPGSDLAQAEESWLRAGGGPGHLENKIHAVSAKNYKGKVPHP